MDEPMSSGVRPYAFDRKLLDRVRSTGRPDFSVYPFPFRAVVAGRGSHLATEIRLDRCREDRIPVFRRPQGGCAVFLDPGNLIVSVALPAKGFSGVRDLFDRCNRQLINGFFALGLTGIYQDGISDLVLDNRKIGGTCLHRSKDLAYYSAAILVTANLDLVSRYLPHPPREPDYRKGRSHAAFLTCLDRYYPGTTPGRLSREMTSLLTP